MHEQRTNADEMARSRGLANGKGFRRWLGGRLPEHQESGDWSTDIGSPGHAAMKRELDVFMAPRR
jgi:hypothetical protein